MVGIVYLIGAGPGDAGLLTIRGASCLHEADVIVYDYLADKKLLSYAKNTAEIIYVGKKAGKHTLRQEGINQLLVNKAKEGKVVARLKGGDPFVFGRGGEEALALRENHLAFEIVPGVTSAIAAAAYAGIPVTHRKVAASFTVVTGHQDPTREKSAIDWQNLAKGADTLVFLMGVGNLVHITDELIANGKDPSTPAALVRWGTKPQQEVLVSTLRDVAADAKKQQLKPPAIFIVGNVVNLRTSLRWFDNKELFGKRILVTRARNQASKLTAGLEELGASCIEAPVIRIEDPDDNFTSLDNAIENLKTYDWLIFTSVNGVRRFFTRLFSKELDARAFAGLRIATIGSSTAQTLNEYGIKADLLPKAFCAEGILEKLAPFVKMGTKILLPRAKKARAVLPDELRQKGAQVDVVQCYQTVTDTHDYSNVIEKLQHKELDIITFASSSTVTNFLTLINNQKELLTDVTIACIGPVTAKTCQDNGLRPDIVAEKYTIDYLIKAICAFCCA